MGCRPAVAGQIRRAGVFIASLTFSTRTPRAITRESMAPKITAAMAAAITQVLLRALNPLCQRCDPIIFPQSHGQNRRATRAG
jgi:hypothetical protein